MKALQIIATIGVLFSLHACSTCYECSEEVIYYDNDNNPIDTNVNSEEFCTADQNDVKAREDEGATCQVQ